MLEPWRDLRRDVLVMVREAGGMLSKDDPRLCGLQGGPRDPVVACLKLGWLWSPDFDRLEITERGMGASHSLDPDCHPPGSETPDYHWNRDPEMLAQEIGASVIRRLERTHYARLNTNSFCGALRNALDAEIRAAFRKLGLWSDPSPDRASER